MRSRRHLIFGLSLLAGAQLFQTAMAQDWSLSGNGNASTRSRLGTTNTIPLRLMTNSATRLYIDSIGNVGIGTTVPATRFSIQVSGYNAGSQVTNGTVDVRTVLQSSIFSGPYAQIGTRSNHPFQLMANNGWNQLVVMPNGLIGVGTGTASIAGLTVDTKVGATNAVFGSNTTGVAIESDWPGIGFNTYYNGGRKFIGSGFGGLLSFNPTNGLFAFYGSKASGSKNAAVAAYANLAITAAGNVGIGTATPAYKLDVCGVLRAKEILVQTGWCDYVFEDGYRLRPLSEVERFIRQNKHLPDVPPGAEIETNGLPVAQMDSIFIKKIEELTLYVIEQNKQIAQLQQKLERMEQAVADKRNR